MIQPQHCTVLHVNTVLSSYLIYECCFFNVTHVFSFGITRTESGVEEENQIHKIHYTSHSVLEELEEKTGTGPSLQLLVPGIIVSQRRLNHFRGTTQGSHTHINTALHYTINNNHVSPFPD